MSSDEIDNVFYRQKGNVPIRVWEANHMREIGHHCCASRQNDLPRRNNRQNFNGFHGEKCLRNWCGANNKHLKFSLSLEIGKLFTLVSYTKNLYSISTLIETLLCLSSAVITFKLGIFTYSSRDDRWHLPRFGRSYSLAERDSFRRLKFCNFPKRKPKECIPCYNMPVWLFLEVLEMENKKTCADCINLGREVYCMKCKRLKNGYKDLFVDAAPVQAKPPIASKK